ncbi:hypothetical protein BCV63_04090 [Cylindrospermopsis raciborskii CS-508]|jgi:hypothetical protein|nr:hypothetical protein [Cylindrospermopsis raciborskii]KRH96453.1 hypothetical protein ASL19_07555 [Cylindrospermopsis sp. CR12]MBA4456625.1 hypothetical protein [Cylindrospermopsis raciborskii CS-506_B]OHY34230.1 hypothetical protein BCV63_04090 [Cylindrospermopsis raciborskii CS-508]
MDVGTVGVNVGADGMDVGTVGVNVGADGVDIGTVGKTGEILLVPKELGRVTPLTAPTGTEPASVCVIG